MIRIGKLTDYAMLIMSHMAKNPLSLLSATELADALHLTVPTVSKILKMLAEAGMVTSTRGAEGGYLLAKAANNITVADVIAAMEGDLAMTECCESIGLCTIDSMCALRENWRKINSMIHAMLSKVTILNMMAPDFSGKLNAISTKMQALQNDK